MKVGDELGIAARKGVLFVFLLNLFGMCCIKRQIKYSKCRISRKANVSYKMNERIVDTY